WRSKKAAELIHASVCTAGEFGQRGCKLPCFFGCEFHGIIVLAIFGEEHDRILVNPCADVAVEKSKKAELAAIILNTGLHSHLSESSLHFEQLAGLVVARCGAAVFAGGDAGQGDELTPAERGAGRSEFFTDCAVILFRVERAVLADAVAQQ